MSGILGVACIFDPRYKKKFIEYYFSMIYGGVKELYVGKVITLCRELVEEYQLKFSPTVYCFDYTSSSSSTISTGDSYKKATKWMTGFDDYVNNGDCAVVADELDSYLDEKVIPRMEDFNILSWWKTNANRVVSPHCNKLHPSTLEALMCCQSLKSEAISQFATFLEEEQEEQECKQKWLLHSQQKWPPPSSPSPVAHKTHLLKSEQLSSPSSSNPEPETYPAKTTPSSSHSKFIAFRVPRPYRRFTVSASASEDSDLLTKIPPDNRSPASIITGFLGSGKTTLLNHILTADHGKRIAVIENEYGEVDIDGSLVAAKTTGAEDIIMLNNGCLCCTVRGLANPAPIIQTFYAEDAIFNEVKLDGVVTLVDAKHAGFHLDEVKPKGVVNEAVEQIAYADRIIVNKTDLVGGPQVASLVERIKNINRMAHMKRTEFGKVDLDYVLGIGGFDLERIESAVDAKEDDAAHDHHDHDHGHHHHHHEHDHEHEHHHDHHSHDHSHDPGVSSVSIVCEGNLDLDKANMWLGTLLMERSEDIYRMKGLLSVRGMNGRFVFQGVHGIFQGSPDRM
ncbi:CobW C-terminal domain-containing protein [Citrus sinensis]|uniref:CobW C-terminal domain-containing protein n=2 Tax=Citrus sinensis TaxID=2711 RepID=A0ACB8JCD1_CITSI|nr:CobW C-terminal domain-containing protein [Citrus sinensis]